MLTKKTVGKVQLILAGLILLAGIIGLIGTCYMYKQYLIEAKYMSTSLVQSFDYIKNFSSNESRYIAFMTATNNYQEKMSFSLEILILVLGFSIILIAFSLNLILESLSKLSEKWTEKK